LYLETLNQIGNPESKDGFIGARYKPATYIVAKEEFLERFGEDVAGMDLRVAQTNLSDFMRKLLVMRFESSKMAFKSTIEKMIQNNLLIVNWWDELGLVPIMKKGNLPDPTEFDLEDGLPDNDLEFKLDFLRKNKGLLEIPIEWIDIQFIDDVKHDISILSKIHDSWFGSKSHSVEDPKLDKLGEAIIILQAENPERKIVVFSAYADTVNYVSETLIERKVQGVLNFTAADSSKETRKTLLSNFDAAYVLGPQEDSYQVLICTDALSEGVNLHRAGVVINYDIPYNPTRVIQRIGRINRINKKVFDTIHIYNFFPTVVGDSEINIKAISTLKINLINNIVGSDTRSLTPDETLQSFHKDDFDVQKFFKDEYERADKGEDELSWDSVFIEDYEVALKNKTVMDSIEKIPRRSRISRSSKKEERGVIFSKRGQGAVFVTSTLDTEPQVLSTEDALNYFKADEAEIGVEVTPTFSKLFDFAKEKLNEKHSLAEIRGRRKDALTLIEAVRLNLPAAESYCLDLSKIIKEYDDVSDGTLKDLSQIREKSPEKIFEIILKLIPESFIKNILSRVDRMETESEVILLAEEFIK
jgi:superfamily II DNA/RNA helicase